MKTAILLHPQNIEKEEKVNEGELNSQDAYIREDLKSIPVKNSTCVCAQQLLKNAEKGERFHDKTRYEKYERDYHRLISHVPCRRPFLHLLGNEIRCLGRCWYLLSDRVLCSHRYTWDGPYIIPTIR
jgi:hypothetical protein